MKLLVTGGAGYIGGVVTHQLVAAGHQVTVVDDLSTGHADVIPAGAEFHELSIHDVASVLTPDAGFDGVLHFAAKIAAGESVIKPELYWDTNVRGSLALLDAVRAAGGPPAGLLLHRRRLRHPGRGLDRRVGADPADQPVRVEQARRRPDDHR